MEDNTTMGQRIRTARKSIKMSQQELADKVGISFGSIRRYESGERVPRADALYNIANVLETSISYLAGYIDDPRRRSFVEDQIAYAVMDAFSSTEKKDEEQPRFSNESTCRELINANLDRMNWRGQEDVAEYTDKIIKIPEYQKGHPKED